MSDSPAGKGPRNRLKGEDLNKYEKSKLWDNIDAEKVKNTRIFNENKHLIEGSNVEILDCDISAKKKETSNGGWQRCKDCK